MISAEEARGLMKLAANTEPSVHFINLLNARVNAAIQRDENFVKEVFRAISTDTVTKVGEYLRKLGYSDVIVNATMIRDYDHRGEEYIVPGLYVWFTW